MKKVFIDGFVFGRKMTGLERHFDKTIDILQDLNDEFIDEITVLTPNLPKKKMRFKTIQVRPLFFNFIFFLIAHNKVKNCDIYFGISGMMPIFLSKKIKHRILFVHDLFWYDDKYKSFKHYIYFKLFDLSVKRATKLVTVSYETQSKLTSIYNSYKNIDVIPNYLPSNAFSDVKRVNKKQVFLSVGLNSERKSPILCYQIAKYFYTKYGYSWKIVGINDAIVLKYKSVGIDILNEPFIEIIRDVSDKLLYKLYNECSYTFILSEAEGFCYPVLEAQAHKCIPILSRINVLKEVAGDFVFKKCSFELNFNDMIDDLELLLLDRIKTEEIIKSGINNVSHFSKENTRERFKKLLSAL
jgi:glycosyltransferase involved in cell wall biosynthesis